MFQVSFKYYKSKNPPPSFKNVLVIGDNNYPFKEVKPNPKSHAYISIPTNLPTKEWKIYEVVTRPGLFVIANPFTPAGQRYWMATSLLDYPAQPNSTNRQLDDDKTPRSNSWWQKLTTFTDSTERRKFANTLRWSTLGYQYDWTNKLYDETRKEEFPSNLASLVRFIATVLGFDRFSPEAAIVNYYPTGTTLAGHTDHSENDLTAPLFSISFGQPALFLIGGTTRDEPADAILLRSGDILAMTGTSRQCYHAVPRVCSDLELPDGVEKCIERWQPSTSSAETTIMGLEHTNFNEGRSEAEWALIDEYIQHSRININVRQVLKENQISL